jgi:hypothetical protein
MRKAEKETEWPSYRKTIDLENLYDGIALQTDFDNHSKFWNAKV